MSTAPAKTPPFANRERLSFNEVLDRWNWTENDLKEAVIEGHLVPCIYEKGAIWALRFDGSGNRSRITPAVFSNRWMYAIGVKQTGSFECSFDYLACTYDALTNDEAVYQRDGNGFVNNRITLADVVKRGAFAREELERYENEHAVSGSTSGDETTGKQTRWWQRKYNVISIASRIHAQWKSEGRDVNQSGARAGKYSLTSLGEAVAAEIGKAEKANKSPKTITGKTIVNYLKQNKWD